MCGLLQREVVTTYQDLSLVDATCGSRSSRAAAEDSGAAAGAPKHPKAWTPHAMLKYAFDLARGGWGGRIIPGLLKTARSTGQQVACVVKVAAAGLAVQAEELARVVELRGAAGSDSLGSGRIYGRRAYGLWAKLGT